MELFRSKEEAKRVDWCMRVEFPDKKFDECEKVRFVSEYGHNCYVQLDFDCVATKEGVAKVDGVMFSDYCHRLNVKFMNDGCKNGAKINAFDKVCVVYREEPCFNILATFSFLCNQAIDRVSSLLWSKKP